MQIFNISNNDKFYIINIFGLKISIKSTKLLELQIEKLQNIINKHKEKINSQKEEINKHKEKINTQKEEINKHKEKINTQKEEINKYKEKINTQKEEINKYKENLITILSNNLHNKNIYLDKDFNKHLLFMYENNINIIGYDSNNKLIYLEKDGIITTSLSYFTMYKEVFCLKIYNLEDNLLKYNEYVIFDIGCNRGYATLFFANKEYCKSIYSFELITPTYQYAVKNVELNHNLKDKIHLYNYGLGNKNETIKATFYPDKDGSSSINNEYIDFYNEKVQAIETECIIKKASETIKDIISKNNIKEKIIIKIDVEGAEYDIFNSLIDEYPELFEQVEIIIGEFHLGIKDISEKLNKFRFNNIAIKTNPKYRTDPFLYIKAQHSTAQHSTAQH